MPLNRDMIEQLRKDRGLNQTQASEAAGFGIGHAAQVRWHQIIDPTNDPQLSSVEAIARVLKCSVLKILTPTAKPTVTRGQKRSRPSSADGSKA